MVNGSLGRTDMGIGVTVWHDLDAGAEGKLDHVVLTTTGLWAVDGVGLKNAFSPIGASAISY